MMRVRRGVHSVPTEKKMRGAVYCDTPNRYRLDLFNGSDFTGPGLWGTWPRALGLPLDSERIQVLVRCEAHAPQGQPMRPLLNVLPGLPLGRLSCDPQRKEQFPNPVHQARVCVAETGRSVFTNATVAVHEPL